jgi:hypothetical protein
LRNISGGENYLAKILYLFDIHNHFYTTSAVERDRALNELGYTYKEISCYVHQTQYPETIPLYRLRNSIYDDHFYTTSLKESDNAVTEFGYTFEGVSCYVYQTHISGTIPLYRLWNYKNNDHFYTTSIEERDNFVVNLGYIEEVSYYVMGVNNPGTIPLFCLIKTA